MNCNIESLNFHIGGISNKVKLWIAYFFKFVALCLTKVNLLPDCCVNVFYLAQIQVLKN